MTPVLTPFYFILLLCITIFVVVASAAAQYGKSRTDWSEGDHRRTGYGYIIPTQWLTLTIGLYLFWGIPLFGLLYRENPLFFIASKMIHIM